METTFNRLIEYGLHINEENSQICLSQVVFLGFDVNSDGLQIPQTKIDEIVNFNVPGNLAQPRTFLGVVGFLRRFISRFSTIAVPLFDLLKKGKQFKWTGKCQNSFIAILVLPNLLLVIQAGELDFIWHKSVVMY